MMAGQLIPLAPQPAASAALKRVLNAIQVPYLTFPAQSVYWVSGTESRNGGVGKDMHEVAVVGVNLKFLLRYLARIIITNYPICEPRIRRVKRDGAVMLSSILVLSTYIRTPE